MRNAFPDLEAEVDDLVAADDKVAVRVSFRGTHRGEFQGITATGRTIHYVSHIEEVTAIALQPSAAQTHTGLPVDEEIRQTVQ